MYVSTDSHIEGASTQRMDAHRATARRVLKELFDLEADAVDLTDATTLSDFAQNSATSAAASGSLRAWAIRVKEQVYAYFGIDCEVDEPLVDVLVRLEAAEHGVRFAHQQ